MKYIQFLSQTLFNKPLPIDGNVIQLSVQARPDTYIEVVSGQQKQLFKIGDIGILEWDSINLNKEKIQVNVINEDQTLFENALIDILYNENAEGDEE